MKNNLSTLLFILILLSLLVSCRNSITDPESTEVIEEKTLVYSLQPIAAPAERVQLKPGENYDIKWQITENLDNIKITLLRKFKEVGVISESATNNGLFNWSIPRDLPGSHHYRIKISTLYNTAASSTSVEFEIQKNSETPQEDE
jgi:hypothetical protein